MRYSSNAVTADVDHLYSEAETTEKFCLCVYASTFIVYLMIMRDADSA